AAERARTPPRDFRDDLSQAWSPFADTNGPLVAGPSPRAVRGEGCPKGGVRLRAPPRPELHLHPSPDLPSLMKTFRGGTAAELIAFRLDESEDLVKALSRAADELNLGSIAVVMASGVLGIVRLIAAGMAGPAPLGVIVEHTGPLAIVSMQGWILS